MDREYHKKALERMCRVCGQFLAKTKKATKTTYECTSNTEKLRETFNIHVEDDDEAVHPILFCHNCYKLHHFKSKVPKGRIYEEQRHIFPSWSAHNESSTCPVCTHYSRLSSGGRPKKNKSTGRPPSTGYKSAVTYIREIAPTSLFPPDTPFEVIQTDTLSNLMCPVCSMVVDKPIELSLCRTVLCSECLATTIAKNRSLICPVCNVGHLNDFTTAIQEPSPLVMNILRQAKVNCKSCKLVVQLGNYIPHLDSQCARHMETLVTIQDVLQRPLDSPLHPSEQQLQSRLTKRCLASSPEDNVMRVKTGGQVSALTKV